MSTTEMSDPATSDVALHDTVRDLLAASAHSRDELAHAIDIHGPASVAAIAVAEIVSRSHLDELLAPGWSCGINLSFTHTGHAITTQVIVGPDEVRTHPGVETVSTSLPGPVLCQDLVEVVAALYGPLDHVSADTRELSWPGDDVIAPPEPGRPALPSNFYGIVHRVESVLDRRRSADLTALAVRHGTDKWGSMHRYTGHYEHHLAPLRQRPLKILEIGIGGRRDISLAGASLRAWKEYFPRAHVYGIDIIDRSDIAEERLTPLLCDQSDRTRLAEISEEFGPFDIVVDDGSHVSEHVLASFHTLFPRLSPSGLYFIEDLQTSYWPEIYGGQDTDLNDPTFTIGFLKTLIDGLHHNEFLRDDARAPQPTDEQITGVHVYRNLCCLEKGNNRDGSIMARILRANRTG